MKTNIETLREEICDLSEKISKGEILQSYYDNRIEKLSFALSNAIVQSRLAPDEKILCEHHVIRAHTKLAGKVLKESEQEIVSIWATDDRLFRLKAIQSQGKPALFYSDPLHPERRDDCLEELRYVQISNLQSCWEFRKSELLTGLLIILFALAFHRWLQVTSIVLVLFGLGGALHGAFFPTRWVEISVNPPRDEEPFFIYTPRRRSAKKLIRAIRTKISPWLKVKIYDSYPL